jgi:CheY-like chemotaxis protein
MVNEIAKGKKVLVVEDERPLQEAIQAKLEASGFFVATARSVEQALQYLKDHKTVDVVWLDHYLLGKENGLDFVGMLKNSDGPWKLIPIFVVSNTATADKVQSYMRLGITQYYVKAEHRLDGIISEIEKYLENPEK